MGAWGHPKVLGDTPGLSPPPLIPRIGNLLVPNDNYCKFEDWLMPILDQMVDEQETQVGGGGQDFTPPRWGGARTPPFGGFGVLRGQHPQGVRWTPSRMIARLGKEINNPESVCYWAQKVKGGGKQGVAPPPGHPGPSHHRFSPPQKIPEQDPGAEPGADGRLAGGHDLLPLLQTPGAGAGHRGG